jgi:iron only hydrogenase large subunit-like protein
VDYEEDNGEDYNEDDEDSDTIYPEEIVEILEEDTIQAEQATKTDYKNLVEESSDQEMHDGVNMEMDEDNEERSNELEVIQP